MKTLKKLSLIAATFGVLTITTPLVLTSCNGDTEQNKNPDGGGGSGNPGGGQGGSGSGGETEKPDGGTGQPGEDGNDGDGENTSYQLNVSNYGNSISLNKTSAKYGEEISLKWNGSTDAIVSYYYMDSSDNKVTINGNTFTMPKSDIDIFVEVKYSVNVKITSSEGSVTINGKNCNNGDVLTFADNSVINYKITPISGKKLSSFKVYSNGQLIDTIESLEGTYSINKNSNLTFDISFINTALNNVYDILIGTMRQFDIYDFFPRVFDVSKRVDKDKINSQLDFNASFVNVSDIQQYGIGKQLNQFMDITNSITSIANGAKIIYNLSTTIAQLWQDNVNSNADKMYEFESKLENESLSFKITMDQQKCRIMAKALTANLDITQNRENDDYTIRIQLSNANAMKIEKAGNKIQIGVRYIGLQRKMLTIDIDNNGDKVMSLFNFMGIDSEDKPNDKLGLTTKSVAKITGSHLTVIGKKGDFIYPNSDNRNMEVYDLSTGKFIGSRVFEKSIGVGSLVTKYNTNWYPFNQLSGFNTIKMTDSSNQDDPFNTYVNGSNKEFSVDRAIFSRQFDIEQKSVYIYTKNSEGKIEEKVVKVPMFFIQTEYEEKTGYTKVNSLNNLNVENKMSHSNKQTIDSDYTSMQEKYNSYSDSTNSDTVKDFIGEQDTWFGATN